MLCKHYLMATKLRCIPVSEISTIQLFEPAFYDPKTKTTYTISVPDVKLTGLSSVQVSDTTALSDIPAKGGCYWIATNAPITHCLNSGKKIPLADDDGFTVVYNGVCSTSLRKRVQEHLLRTSGLYGEMSGLSVDLICQPPRPGKGSHAKCAWTARGRKLPRLYIDDKWNLVAEKQVVVDTLFLTDEEREYLGNNDVVYFKNGINVADAKHRDFVWKVFWCTCEDNTMRGFIETSWRKLHGVPQLCSYISGR